MLVVSIGGENQGFLSFFQDEKPQLILSRQTIF